MRLPQNASPRLALALIMAGAGLCLGPAKCVAGEKIQFSLPGNPALVEKPEVVKDEPEDDTPFKLGTGKARFNTKSPRMTPSIIVLPPEKDKKNGSRWDSGLAPFGARDRDDAASLSGRSPLTGEVTNSFSLRRDEEDLLYGGSKRDLFGNTSPGANTSGSYGSKLYQGPQTSSGAGTRSGVTSYSWMRRDDAASDDSSKDSRDDRNSSLSGWARGFSSDGTSYRDQLRDSYRGASATVPQASAASSSGGFVAPKRGGADDDNSSFGLSAFGDARASRGQGAFSGVGYDASPAGTRWSPGVGRDNPSVVVGAHIMQPNQTGFATSPGAKQPAVLPFPSKPGSLFK